MKAAFVRSETLRTAFGLPAPDSDADESALAAYYDTNFSAVSVETCILYVVATCAALMEYMFDWFTEDVDNIVNNERYGRKGWYEKTAKAFQYQNGNGVDYALNIDTGEYDDFDENAQIVKHASAEASNGIGVKLKVAKENNGVLAPLSDLELTAFTTYINRLKPAGVPVTVISRNPDRLAVEMAVYYDPLVFNAATALQKVKDTISDYLNSIEFNGEFVTMTMVDRLQSVPGLDIIEAGEVKAKHEGYGYTPIENNARYVPKPGYMTLGDDAELAIEVIANK
jgi:hypothetical protein